MAATAGTGSGFAPGVLLSTTDPDHWIGQRVQVASGRHAGQLGTVVSSGNGWVQIETSVGEVAKRAYELQVAGSDSHQGGGGDGGRNAKRQRTSKNSSARGGDDHSVGGDARGRLILNMDSLPAGGLDTFGNDDSTGAMLLNLGGDNYSSSSRKRPRAFSDSLMSLSPRFLGDGTASNFFTFRTTYPNASSASSATSANLLSSLPNDDESETFSLKNQSYLHTHRAALAGGDLFRAAPGSDASDASKIPLKSAAFIDAKKSFTTKYVQRHSAKIANRPNLVDWKQQIDATLVTDALFERQSARMFEEAHCEVCSLDKWPGAKFCWNESCPISPVYFKLTGAARVVDAAEGATAEMAVDAAAEPVLVPARTKIAVTPNKEVPSRDNDYLLHLPARVIGAPTMRSFNHEPFSSRSSAAPGLVANTTDFDLVQGGDRVLHMAIRKPAADAGEAPGMGAYTQYYHRAASTRADSFAGGETDTEVPSSPITVQ
jgi:hypothetical protein